MRKISSVRFLKRKIGAYEYPFYRDFLEICFRKFSKAGCLVLDAGCGKGPFLKRLRKDVCGVGIDIERAGIKEAKKGKESKRRFLVRGDLQNLPFKTETFDIIFCQDVLEHVKEGKKAINEMAFVLKKNGVILISTSNLLNPAFLLDTLLPNKVCAKIIKKLGGPEHYERTRRFFPWKFIKELTESGLSVGLIMFGYPPIGKPWMYHHSVKPPMIYLPWIVFNKMTNFNFLREFKEVIVAIARK